MTVGSTITIAGNQPSLGILPCSTLYNFYPSDLAGNYLSGKIYFNRNTGGQLGGLTLAPEGNIHLYFSNLLVFFLLTYVIFVL